MSSDLIRIPFHGSERPGEAQGVIDDLLREAKAGASQRNADRQQLLRGIAGNA